MMMTSRKSAQGEPRTDTQMSAVSPSQRLKLLLLVAPIHPNWFAPQGYNEACWRLSNRLLLGSKGPPSADEFELALTQLQKMLDRTGLRSDEQADAVRRAERRLAMVKSEAQTCGLVAPPLESPIW